MSFLFSLSKELMKKLKQGWLAVRCKYTANIAIKFNKRIRQVLYNAHKKAFEFLFSLHCQMYNVIIHL